MTRNLFWGILAGAGSVAVISYGIPPDLFLFAISVGLGLATFREALGELALQVRKPKPKEVH